MDPADSVAIEGLMRDLAMCSRDPSLREELLGCLRKGAWSTTIHCCELQLKGVGRRDPWLNAMTKGLHHALVGTAHLLSASNPENHEKGVKEAISAYKEAEKELGHDTRAVGLLKLLLGRAYAECGDKVSAASAADAYRQSIEQLSHFRDGHVAIAQAWRFQLLARESANTSPEPEQAAAGGEHERIMAELYRQEGDLERATSSYERAIDLFSKANRKQSIMECSQALGDIWKDRKEWARAEESYDDALRHAVLLGAEDVVVAVRSKLRAVIQAQRNAPGAADQGTSGAPAVSPDSGESPGRPPPSPDGAEPGTQAVPAGGVDLAEDHSGAGNDAPEAAAAPESGSDAATTEESPQQEPSVPVESPVEQETASQPPEQDAERPPPAEQALGMDTNKVDANERILPFPSGPRLFPLKLHLAPVLGKVAAGNPKSAWEMSEVFVEAQVFLIDGVEYGTRRTFPEARHLRPGAFNHAFRVCGDSMSPTLEDGEVVLANTNRAPQNGEICVAWMSKPGDDRGTSVVKRYFYGKDRILLQADNPTGDSLVLLHRLEDDGEQLRKESANPPSQSVQVHLLTEALVISKVVAVLAPLDAGGLIVRPSPAAAPAPS
jgi:tetratricopeptide (TPR) repeat protein